jgi:coenzyme F420-reducing hydrogenase beta subunit
MYLDTGNKNECFGCEGCVQKCGVNALSIIEDEEGFRYPEIDAEKCINCGLCRRVCPYSNIPAKDNGNKYVFGGYNKDSETRFESTSGGAFSAIVDAFCDENYVIFGAEAKGLLVFHSYITDKEDIGKFRKSKYLQSIMGLSYRNVRKFLREGKKVLFSGTPCQIAGLIAFLGNTDQTNLLTVEVVCEGVPSPLYFRKMEKELEKKYGEKIESLDYRYTGKSLFSNGAWDFEKMRIELMNKKKIIIKDRWFNPFWSVWLQHLMSRPSCYKCPFTTPERVADITLGDLWGVHLYCPELYGKNGGSSLVVCNTEKGKEVFRKAQSKMYGHELKFEDALKYQGPMRKQIAENEKRESFMADLKSNISFKALNKKWANRPSVKLLFQKYIWGNRQKVFIWNLKHRKIGEHK